MKIVVIGAAGNLGSSILKALSCSKTSAHGLSRSNWGSVGNDIQNVDMVIHAAGNLKTDIFLNPAKYFHDNLMTSMNALELCKTHNIQRFFFISSCAVYGSENTTTEKIKCTPESIYGQTKLFNERVISEFCSKNGIQYSCLRVFNLYGGKDNFSIISKIHHSGSTGEELVVNNNGEAYRDFIHVDDVTKIISILVKLNEFPKIMNIGTGSAIKIKDVIRKAKQKYPKLSVMEQSVSEVKFSQADIKLLHETIGNFEFRSVLKEFE